MRTTRLSSAPRLDSAAAAQPPGRGAATAAVCQTPHAACDTRAPASAATCGRSQPSQYPKPKPNPTQRHHLWPPARGDTPAARPAAHGRAQAAAGGAALGAAASVRPGAAANVKVQTRPVDQPAARHAGGSAHCQALHAMTRRPRLAAWRACRGAAQLASSPWPSLPARPSPQVKSSPPDVTAAAWNSPHATCPRACAARRRGAQKAAQHRSTPGHTAPGAAPGQAVCAPAALTEAGNAAALRHVRAGASASPACAANAAQTGALVRLCGAVRTGASAAGARACTNTCSPKPLRGRGMPWLSPAPPASRPHVNSCPSVSTAAEHTPGPAKTGVNILNTPPRRADSMGVISPSCESEATPITRDKRMLDFETVKVT